MTHLLIHDAGEYKTVYPYDKQAYFDFYFSGYRKKSN